jgi:DNA helicase-2/ATP-dependent DNA helicase PcrA
VRRGKKYPTVLLAGATSTRRPRSPRRAAPRVSGISFELDTYRKRVARQLKWKSYMVFQRATIAAIASARPASHADLARIVGLGPAKIARFGDDILAMVRRHS